MLFEPFHFTEKIIQRVALYNIFVIKNKNILVHKKMSNYHITIKKIL